MSTDVPETNVSMVAEPTTVNAGKKGGTMRHYSATKWDAIRTSYFQDKITSASQLAKMHRVNAASIRMRVMREGWSDKFNVAERKANPSPEDAADDKLDTPALKEAKKDQAQRRLVTSATSLLDKVHERIKLLGPRDGGEINEMVTTVKSLEAMLDKLLGTSKVAAGSDKVQVNILVATVEAADREKERRAEAARQEIKPA